LTLERMLAWFATELVPEGRRFFYLRVWNPDEEHPVDEYGTPCVLAAAPLGGTGLSVQLNQVGIVGDHWVIAARPTTPDVVVPWELGEGAAPHGPRRFYCPLAIIHWTLEEDELQVEAESCRRTFRALTRLGGCCSVTVGDGETSHGDYPTVGEALLALPLTGPGKICVLPGVYQEIVHISGRSGLVIEGCGPRTIFRTPPGNMRSHAIVTVDGCEDVILRDFAVEATGQFGVGVLAASDGTQIPSRRITLENLVITTERDATLDPPSTSQLAITETATAFPVCTIAAIGVEQLKLVECTLTMIGDLSAAANVLLAACTRVVVRECRILTPPGEGVASKAWGGLHIAGNCSDVLVERCEIHEGLGFGITLGSVRALANTDSAPSNEKVIDEGEDCPAVGGGFPYAATDVVKHAPEPGPHGVQLRRNRISGMGSSGISVLGFFPEAAGEAIPQIETHELVIADNLIENNYIHPSEKAPSSALRPVVAFGGIILAHADGLRIHDNRIHANGVDHRHPVCGIYVLHGENIVVENNQIRGNGLAGSGLSGNRAGIALQLVGRRVTVEEDDAGEQLQVSPNSALPAARVRGNVVLQPAGRALQVYGIGPTEDDPSEGDHVGHRVRHRLGGRVLIIVLNDVVGHDEVRGLHHPGVIIWIDRRVRPEANHGDPRAAHAANPIADDPELGRRRAAVDLDFLVTARQEGRQREISPHAGAILVVGDHETSGGVEVAGIAKDRHFAVTDGPERDAVAQSADDLVTLQGDIRAPDQLDAAPGPAPHLCGGRRCKNFAVPDEAVRDLVEDDIRRAAQGPGHGELAAGDREPLREVHGDCAQRERR
jgi:hypothetical protein